MNRKLIRALFLGTLLGLIGVAAEDARADDKPRNDKLPMTADWQIEALKNLGEIVATRDESKTDNRVVWVVAMKTVSQPALTAQFLDENNKAKVAQPVFYTVLKKEKESDPVTRVEVALKLPTAEVQKTIRKVVLDKTKPPVASH